MDHIHTLVFDHFTAGPKLTLNQETNMMEVSPALLSNLKQYALLKNLVVRCAEKISEKVDLTLLKSLISQARLEEGMAEIRNRKSQRSS